MLGQIEKSGSKRLRKVNPDTVEIMKAEKFILTDESLNDVFGISYNTWRKIIRGESVRLSVASRLEQRMAKGPRYVEKDASDTV